MKKLLLIALMLISLSAFAHEDEIVIKNNGVTYFLVSSSVTFIALENKRLEINLLGRGGFILVYPTEQEANKEYDRLTKLISR